VSSHEGLGSVDFVGWSDMVYGRIIEKWPYRENNALICSEFPEHSGHVVSCERGIMGWNISRNMI
jgi:hypothetical protein